jgi:RNA polymerase sigma-70 factor (ECF subfamily)
MVNKSDAFKQVGEVDFERSALSYLDSLYRTALRMTRNEKDAEDLVQEVYLKAFGASNTFEPGSNMRAWLFRIMSNTFLTEIRRRKDEPKKMELGEALPFIEDRRSEAGHSNLSEMGERLASLRDPDLLEAVEDLSEEYRMTLLLAVVEEFSYKDVAHITGVPIGTVMSRLHRAKKILRDKLKNRNLVHLRWSPS